MGYGPRVAKSPMRLSSWAHVNKCATEPLLLCFGLLAPRHVGPQLPAAAAAAESLQSCPTLCDPMDGSPPGSAVPGSLQARTLEWVAISFLASRPGIKPVLPALEGKILTAGLPGKKKKKNRKFKCLRDVFKLLWNGIDTICFKSVSCFNLKKKKSNACESESRSVVSDSLQPHSPWDSPGQNTGVGGLSLLQGIFPTQGSNPGLRNCRRILYQLSHKGMYLSHKRWIQTLLKRDDNIYF